MDGNAAFTPQCTSGIYAASKKGTSGIYAALKKGTSGIYAALKKVPAAFMPHQKGTSGVYAATNVLTKSKLKPPTFNFQLSTFSFQLTFAPHP
jgi:hypothetical protein